MDRNPSLSQFLLARRLFHRLPVTEKLGELSLDQWSYTQLFEPNSFQSGLTSVDGSNIQELSLSLWTLFFAHLRAALLLLFDPLMRRLSRHPVWTDLTDDWTCTVRFVGLAQAGRRLGPTARRAMNAALRKDIDRTYAECVSSLGRKNTLYSSIKRAIKTAEAQVPGTSGLNALEDHTKATLELVEECLVE
ncbi:hypothetical protein DL96DRAFT_1588368 [Flagelloscypha sp. PMI_526]|nr:hypothetical protein DL96DRAFT_1588368 [Flagelloscypha sp. PMI_526]